MKTWEGESIAPPFLISALDGREWLTSRPSHFTPWDTATGIQRTGGCVGPRAGKDSVENKRISCPCQKSNQGRPARRIVAMPTELFMNNN
jgi:hypothetical protein